MGRFPNGYGENKNPNFTDWILFASGAVALKAKLQSLMSIFNGFFVPVTRKVNGKQLTSDITLDYTDVGATRAGYDTVGTDYENDLQFYDEYNDNLTFSEAVDAKNDYLLRIGIVNNCNVLLHDPDGYGNVSWVSGFIGIAYEFRDHETGMARSIHVGSKVPDVYMLADNTGAVVQDESLYNISVNNE